MKKLVFLVLAPFLILPFTVPAYAGTNCQSIYGGGDCDSGSLTVTKQVLQPDTTNTYVDNLGTTDPQYQPASPIYFKISVKNATSSIIQNITVNDTLDNSRAFVAFTYGPGRFDTTTKTLTYTINSLQPGTENTIIIAGRIVSAQELPAGQNPVCPINVVQVTTATLSTQAATEFCIQNTTASPTPTTIYTQTNQTQTKGGIPVEDTFPVYTPATGMSSTPKSGPELLPLLALLPTGGLGLWLRKKAKNKVL